MDQITEIPLSELYTDDVFNGRGAIVYADYANLLPSMKEMGLIQPICVKRSDKRPPAKYMVLAGNCRLAAARALGWEKIECMIKEGLSAKQETLLNLSENFSRRNLTMYQEAKWLERITQEDLVSLRDLQQQLGVTQTWIDDRLILLKMSPYIQEQVANNWFKASHLRVLEAIANPREREEIAINIKKKLLSGERIDLTQIGKKASAKRAEIPGKPQDSKTLTHFVDIMTIALGADHPVVNTLMWAAGIMSQDTFDEFLREQLRGTDYSYNSTFRDVELIS